MEVDGEDREEALEPEGTLEDLPTLQVTIHTGMNMISLRDMNAASHGKLIRTPGIIIQTSTLSSRAVKLRIQCRQCRSTRTVYPSSGLSGLGGGEKGLPRVCDA